MITNLGVFLIFESPKFVYNKSKHKAVKILNKIAAVNGKSPIHPNSVMNRETSSNDRVYSIIDLVVYSIILHLIDFVPFDGSSSVDLMFFSQYR